MPDDPDLSPDPELGRRWSAIRQKLEAHAPGLQDQGGLVEKVTSSGRRAWAVRYIDRSGLKPVHRSLFIGDDPRLIDLVRRQLEAYRMIGGMEAEIAGHARFAASAGVVVRHLAAGWQRRRPRA